jgi:hypothetical protein
MRARVAGRRFAGRRFAQPFGPLPGYALSGFAQESEPDDNVQVKVSESTAVKGLLFWVLGGAARRFVGWTRFSIRNGDW